LENAESIWENTSGCDITRLTVIRLDSQILSLNVHWEMWGGIREG
jgi:hypothetical protein